MFADIIPALRLPRRFTFFTYLIPSALEGDVKIGQIIATTFRGQKIQGLVKNIYSTTALPVNSLKPIDKILHPEALFSKIQFQLADWLTDYYQTSLGLVVRTMIPEVPLRKSSRTKAVNWQDFTAEKISIAGDKNLLLQYSTVKYRNNFLYSQIIKNKKQTLILTPEMNSLPPAGSFLPPELREKTAIFHSNLNKNEYFSNWLRAINGEAQIILGTRQAVFSPFQDLGLIIVVDEEDSDFKQWDQNPRYDSRTTAKKLAELTGAQLIFTSSALRIETRYLAEADKSFELIVEPENKVKTEIVNLKDEIKGGNYSLISDEVSREIIEAKTRKQKAVLYLNRRGLSSSVVCGDCGYIFSCPGCLLPLPLHRGGQLRCHHCSFELNLPASCPNCHGVQFKFPGRGTELIETELQKIWPGCRVLRLDSDVDLKTITQKQIDSADIYLGTDLALKLAPWPQVGLVSILLSDNLLFIPHFRAGERLWQNLKRIETLTAGSLTDKIYLQTFNPDKEIFKKFIAKKDEEFYRENIESRQELNYPPFGQLIKIIIQFPDQNQTKKEAEILYNKLTTKQKSDRMETQINEPTPVYTSRVRGRWRYVIIIKSNSSDIKALLKLVPEYCLIDVDPEDLI